jgi:hypothetical protein
LAAPGKDAIIAANGSEIPALAANDSPPSFICRAA